MPAVCGTLPASARLRLYRERARAVLLFARRRLRGEGRRTREGIVELYDGPAAEAALEAYRRNPIDIYRKDGRLVLEEFQEILRLKAEEFARHISAKQARNVLEVGANCAITTAALARLLPDVRFTAFDSSQRACRAASSHHRGPVVRGDALHLPFRSQSFDMVYTHSALYTLEDQLETAVTEIARVTRRWVLFVEPFFESLTWFEHMYYWHKGFASPVLPRLDAMGVKIRSYELLRDSHHHMLKYWMALGEISPRPQGGL